MTATNINLSQFLGILASLRSKNVKTIDLDMVPDPDNVNMNKLVIHIIDESGNRRPHQQITVRNPELEDEDDIYNLFEGLV